MNKRRKEWEWLRAAPLSSGNSNQKEGLEKREKERGEIEIAVSVIDGFSADAH